jgi:hypothetical protein
VAIDLNDRQVQDLRCSDCGREYKRVVIFATKDGDAYSTVSAVCHGHPDDAVWLDATFGSWDEPFDVHVTFSCQITHDGAGLVDALVASKGEADYYGERLTRAQGLEHPQIGSVWELVDLIVAQVPEVRNLTE